MSKTNTRRAGERVDLGDLTKCKAFRRFPKRNHARIKGGLFTFAEVQVSIASRLEYNGWLGWERLVPVAEVANLWAAPRLFRDLRAEEKCIALNKFMARPRLWSTRSSWRAPRRVSRIEILLSSSTAVVSLSPQHGNCAVRFYRSVDRGWIPSQFIFSSLKVLFPSFPPTNIPYRT